MTLTLTILAIWIVVPIPFAIIIGKFLEFGMGEE